MIKLAHIPIKFECFKAYEEDTYYTLGSYVVIFRTLYHFATLIYEAGAEIPQVSVDGNYYKIPEPTHAECGDVFAEKIEIQIEDLDTKNQVENILKITNPVNFDDEFKRMGFELSSRQIMYGGGTAIVTKNITDQLQDGQFDGDGSQNRTDLPLWIIS